jgi:hypothetical protein
MRLTRPAVFFSLVAALAMVMTGRGSAEKREQGKPDNPVTYRGAGVAARFDISPPLSSLALLEITAAVEVENERFDDAPTGLEGPRGPQDVDPIVQSEVSQREIPAASASFAGMGQASGPVPPDPNGDVGPNHYVQMVNSRYAVYSKVGTLLAGPANINTLWAGFGGPCEVENSGDPVVLYDQLADRWMLTQFTAAGPTYYNCVALSTGPNPTGTYYRWAFSTGTNFPDYPKYGIWSDAYYISTREFAGVPFAGVGAYALNRTQMIAGNASPQVISFLATPGSSGAYAVGDGLLPADIDGFTLPPAGTPNFFVGSQDNGGPYGAPSDALNIWKFTVNFATPASSSFTLASVVPVTAFDSMLDACVGRSCVPQPGTTQKIDHQGYRQRVLHRAAYRNFGTHQAIVANQSVEASAGMSGIRWWEIRSPNSSPTIFQEGTYAPGTSDGIHRWFGSIAQDRTGNMGLGYSASNGTTTFPSVRYTGRLVSDPAGTMPQGEGAFAAGGGSQTSSAARWGDYSSMNVDPVDDCTFWFTTEYYAATSPSGWSTRIGSFRFPSCTALGTAVMTTPAPGSTLSGTSVTFNWTTGTSVTEYWLDVGTGAAGATNIRSVSTGTATSLLVNGLPNNGATVYVRLWSRIGATWQFNDYTYTASTPVCAATSMTSPTPSSTLSGTALTFNWAGNPCATQFWLDVGTGAPGATNIFSASTGTTPSAAVGGLPNNGSTVYVRLWSYAGSWTFIDYTYTAYTLVCSTTSMTSPAPSSTLTGTSVTFSWAGNGCATQFWLSVGTGAVGATNLYNSSTGLGISAPVSGLPKNGITVFVRLWTFAGSWSSIDYTYTAYTAPIALLQSPVNGSLLTGPATTFTWSTGTGVSGYWLDVGTTQGGTDIFSTSTGIAVSTAVTIPTATCATPPSFTSPTAGSTLAGSSQTFNWTNPCSGPMIWVRLWSNTATGWDYADYSMLTSGYKLDLGTTPGGNDLFLGSQSASSAATAGSLPTNGSTVFASLYYLSGGVWSVRPGSFTASGAVAGFSVDFNTPGHPAGWEAHAGDWLVDATGAEVSYGLSGSGASMSYNSVYNTLDYTVVMKRDAVANDSANRLWVRGVPTPFASTNWWQHAYAFQYTSNGSFSVFKNVDGNATVVQNWTASAAIVQGANWNTLRVKASGGTFSFYINGTLVWTGADPSLTAGRVGYGFFNTDWLRVDSATLSTTLLAAAEFVSLEQQTLNDAAQATIGGAINQAPPPKK